MISSAAAAAVKGFLHTHSTGAAPSWSTARSIHSTRAGEKLSRAPTWSWEGWESECSVCRWIKAPFRAMAPLIWSNSGAKMIQLLLFFAFLTSPIVQNCKKKKMPCAHWSEMVPGQRMISCCVLLFDEWMLTKTLTSHMVLCWQWLTAPSHAPWITHELVYCRVVIGHHSASSQLRTAVVLVAEWITVSLPTNGSRARKEASPDCFCSALCLDCVHTICPYNPVLGVKHFRIKHTRSERMTVAWWVNHRWNDNCSTN